MDRIIEGLVNIENEAVLITKEAENEKRDLPKSIEEHAKKIAERVEQETRQTVKAMYDASQEEYERETEEIAEQSRRKLELLKRMFNERHEEWELSIFNRIVGR